MSKKLWIVLIVVSLMAAMIPVTNAETYDSAPAGVEPYNGLFGADSPLYGLKLFVQHLVLSFEGNATVKLQSQMDLGEQRLSEAYAAAANNNTAAVEAALNAYTIELKDINFTMDCDGVLEFMFLKAGNDLQDQEDILKNLTNSTDVPPAISDMYNRTLNTTQQIKNGRPFIYCNNTSYFIPPGQMKKISAGGQGKTPPGLAKKGYTSPEPLLVNGTVVWPWDEQYNSLYTNMTAVNGTNSAVTLASQLTGKHGNGKGNGKGNGNGNGNGHGKK